MTCFPHLWLQRRVIVEERSDSSISARRLDSRKAPSPAKPQFLLDKPHAFLLAIDPAAQLRVLLGLISTFWLPSIGLTFKIKFGALCLVCARRNAPSLAHASHARGRYGFQSWHVLHKTLSFHGRCNSSTPLLV